MVDIITANEELNTWCGTEGINYYEGIDALGNLFKYAVPKVEAFTLVKQVGEAEYKSSALLQGKSSRIVYDKDSALALFWACYSVITGKEVKDGK